MVIIFDIDDTMFKSKARVLVKNKNTAQSNALSPKQFNSYKLSKGEEFDYGEFVTSSYARRSDKT